MYAHYDCSLMYLSLLLLSGFPSRASGIATADFPSPVIPIFCILRRQFNLSHVVFHHIHKPFGLPRFLFPDNSILGIHLPIHSSSFIRTCPHHLSLASCVFSPSRPTCDVRLMYSFLKLSILALLMKIVTYSTLPHPYPPPVVSSMPPSPTRTTLLVWLPPCTPSLSI